MEERPLVPHTPHMPNRSCFLTVALLAATSLRADTIISVQFQGVNKVPLNYSGVEPDAAAADAAFAGSNEWNHVQVDRYVPQWSLTDSTGANSGAILSISNYNAGYNAGNDTVPDTYLDAYDFSGTSRTFTFTGLAPNQNFTLFLYAFNSGNSHNDRAENFAVGSSVFDTTTANTTSESTLAVDGVIAGVTSSTGTIDGTWAFDSANHTHEIDWSGFQLAVTDPVTSAVPEPATNVLIGVALALGAYFLKR